MDEKITIQELESSENTDNTVVTDTITDNTTTATVAVTSSSVELEVASEITEKVAEKTEKKTRSRKAKKTETVSTTEEKVVSETTKEETTSETVKQYKAKDVFDTRCALLYKSPLAPKCIKGVRGRFYVWSGDVVNNRIRLTDSPSGVGKPGRIIGWVDIDK